MSPHLGHRMANGFLASGVGLVLLAGPPTLEHGLKAKPVPPATGVTLADRCKIQRGQSRLMAGIKAAGGEDIRPVIGLPMSTATVTNEHRPQPDKSALTP